MRQQDRVIMWPVYFDSSKARSGGRRVPTNQAVLSPKIQEIKEVAERLHLTCDLVLDVSYPKTPWNKTGLILVKRKESKQQTIKNIAEQLVELRRESRMTREKM